MVDVKPLEDVVKKWGSRVKVAEGDFKSGVSRSKDWNAETVKSAERYKSGVAAAASEGRFEKGVAQVSTGEWRARTQDKSGRWVEGVGKADADFRKGMGPVLDTIRGVNLTERGPTGSIANYERVRQIGQALHEASKK